MTPLRKQAPTLTLGILIGMILGSQSGLSTLRTAQASPKAARVVIGLKDPLTPTVIRELRGAFKSRILNLAPGNSYALVVLRPGETLAEVQSRSRRIKFVDPEAAMGVAQDAPMVALVIPAPRLAKGKKH